MKVRDLLMLLFWSVLLSDGTLLFSYFISEYYFLTYVFWIAVGIIAGILIGDFKNIILYSIASYFLSSALMFAILSLPVFLGTLSYQVLSDLVYFQNLKLVFTFTFPSMLLINVASGILGGYTGEILLTSHS